MKLLIEDIDPGMIVPLIEGTEGSTKKYYLTGPFAEAVTKNRNGRVYPQVVLENAIKKFTPMIEARRALGELNHPPTPQVNPREASHVIESMSWDKNICIGRARIMTEMPMGKIVRALMDENIQLGMSTRGLGSVAVKNGVNEVQGDYVVNTVDIVSNPSGLSCWVEGVYEHADWVYEASSDSWKKAEAIRAQISKMSIVEVAEKQAGLFQEFLNTLK